MIHEEYIPYPSPAERDGRIAAIIEQALPAPRRLWTAVPALWRSMGFRGLFFGVWDCTFLALLTGAAAWCSAALLAVQQEHGAYTALFITSPVLWAALHGLTMWKERMSGVWELFMTARVTLRQLSALRMLRFGGVCVAASVAASGVVRLVTRGEMSMLRLCGVSFAALFLFAAGSLLAEEYLRPPLGYPAVPVTWAVLGAVLIKLGPRAEVFLAGLPAAVTCCIAAAAAGVYLALIKRRCFTGKEAAAHAVS